MIISDLKNTDLVIDQIYGGSRNGNASDDPLPKLLKVDSGAGFRHRGKRPSVKTLEMLVLKTNFNDLNWPDSINKENGVLVYYGDNHKSQDLLKTNRQGNLILQNLFTETHLNSQSQHFPPIFVFSNTGVYRDVKFLGLVVPGAEGLTSDDDLVAVWRMDKSGNRFLNYKATFTILNVSTISRRWINDIQDGRAASSEHAPKVWLDWLNGRKYTSLRAEPLQTIRTHKEQTDLSVREKEIIDFIYSRYKDSPTDFEAVAAKIVHMAMPNAHDIEVTRPWRDGGRDAIGKYRVCEGAGGIDIDFAMEAKCYRIDNGVGVRQLSRLLSRLRYRQFGVLVTTSYLNKQAYQELKDDQHPVVILSAKDIASLLETKLGDIKSIQNGIEKSSEGVSLSFNKIDQPL